MCVEASLVSVHQRGLWVTQLVKLEKSCPILMHDDDDDDDEETARQVALLPPSKSLSLADVEELIRSRSALT